LVYWGSGGVLQLVASSITTAIHRRLAVNDHPQRGWFAFALKGRKQKYAVFVVPFSGTIASGDGVLKTMDFFVFTSRPLLKSDRSWI
jgi:hypothetical protein